MRHTHIKALSNGGNDKRFRMRHSLTPPEGERVKINSFPFTFHALSNSYHRHVCGMCINKIKFLTCAVSGSYESVANTHFCCFSLFSAPDVMTKRSIKVNPEMWVCVYTLIEGSGTVMHVAKIIIHTVHINEQLRGNIWRPFNSRINAIAWQTTAISQWNLTKRLLILISHFDLSAFI